MESRGRKGIEIVAMHPVTGRIIYEFNSSAEAAVKFNYPSPAIAKAARKFQVYKGYRWGVKDKLSVNHSHRIPMNIIKGKDI
jgi:hypothetical protein